MKRNHWDPEVCSEYLANRLKEGRKEMGYTQSEMAEEMQCSLKSYRKWEKMEGLPCLNYAVHLSCILKHDLAYLVGLRDEKNYDISYIGQETGLSENAIKKISSHMGLEALPESLEQIARLRLEYPEESLTELGNKLCPPISKSGVSVRLKKLTQIAESL